ncbi:MAG TPA: MmcQ/YjbR family DNA-binding protein [Geopsychrobacteraceae bacterium]|nr:MmcQ/YjbR family DNA-binding protein [Geopsychrobacteraceae bacterium]
MPKVGEKIFALIRTNEDPLRLTLKSEPARAAILRELYQAVIPWISYE